MVTNSENTLRTLRPARGQLTATVYSGIAARSSGTAPDHASGVTMDGRDMRRQVIHDGYDPEIFAPPPAAPDPEILPPLPRETTRIALVGRIAGWKGQHIFLQAAALVRDRFPQARFQIIGAPLFGEYEYEQSLHRMVRDLGLEDQVEFLGFREDVPALLAGVDLVVHASTLGEPFGQVVIEGMAAGKAVIATDGGALPEIVIPGVTGLLVPMGDAPAMAEAMAALLSNPARAEAMGAAGRERVRERFTIGHTVRKLEGIYEYLLR